MLIIKTTRSHILRIFNFLAQQNTAENASEQIPTIPCAIALPNIL
jgi:hypothetical protein